LSSLLLSIYRQGEQPRWFLHFVFIVLVPPPSLPLSHLHFLYPLSAYVACWTLFFFSFVKQDCWISFFCYCLFLCSRFFFLLVFSAPRSSSFLNAVRSLLFLELLVDSVSVLFCGQLQWTSHASDVCVCVCVAVQILNGVTDVALSRGNTSFCAIHGRAATSSRRRTARE
jgi:hypothetical protein